MPTPNAHMFQQQHYNAIAKDIRETYARIQSASNEDWDNLDAFGKNVDKQLRLAAQAALQDLALRFARRFQIDSEQFDPVHFLNACSPDPDRFPLGELWQGGQQRCPH